MLEKEVLEKYNSEKIKEVKEKSEKLQNKKDGTSQENTKETSENTNGKTVSLINVKISSGEMEL